MLVLKKYEYIFYSKMDYDRRRHSLSRYESKAASNYVDRYITDEIDFLVQEFLQNLYNYQRRLYKTSKGKYISHKRYVIGLKQTQKLASLGKCVLVLISPDIEEELHDSVEDIKNTCRDRGIPYVFALAKSTYQSIFHIHSSPVSTVCILSIEGANDLFHKIVASLRTSS